MPDSFPHSPFASHPTVVGWALASGNQRWADLLDPAHPAYDPAYLEVYRRKTARHNGLDVADLPMPSLATQARNFAGAVVRAVRSGVTTVTPEEQERRLAICTACEFYRAGRCTRCGCVAKWKARLASEHCPLDPPKW